MRSSVLFFKKRGGRGGRSKCDETNVFFSLVCGEGERERREKKNSHQSAASSGASLSSSPLSLRSSSRVSMRLMARSLEGLSGAIWNEREEVGKGHEAPPAVNEEGREGRKKSTF